MSKFPCSLWLSVSPTWQRFNRPLIQELSQTAVLALWEYSQTPDEPSSLDVPLVLLHDYLKGCDRPIHLIGHGTSGWLGILYARRYPERVKSLTLLSVGVNPAIDWQAHYYVMLQKLPCDRKMILTQMVHSLFGHQCQPKTENLIHHLEQDLISSPSPHTLLHQLSLFPEKVPVPLLVCGSTDDVIVAPCQLHGWQPWLGERDHLWECPQGRHFFHYFHPQEVSQQIFKFWEGTVNASDFPLSCASKNTVTEDYS